MSAHTLSPVVTTEAVPGKRLAGFESRCSCGLVLASSLRTALEVDRAQHVAWHARKAMV